MGGLIVGKIGHIIDKGEKRNGCHVAFDGIMTNDVAGDEICEDEIILYYSTRYYVGYQHRLLPHWDN